MRLKTCSKCGAIKSLDDFQKDKSKPSGYDSWCKECCKAQDDARLNRTRGGSDHRQP